MTFPGVKASSALRDKLLGAAHIFALSSICIAQPLFDILGSNATFFVANRLGGREILTFLLIVSFAIPAIIISLELIIGRIRPSWGKLFRDTAIAILLILMFLPLVKKLEFLSGSVQIAISVLAGGGCAYLYHRKSFAKLFVSALSPAIIVVPVLFIFFTPVSKILFPPSLKAMEGRGIKASAPIILVVFDEFSLVSLMDGNRTIDSVRYPNFYALSKTSNWYRNATTVCDATERAVPAILTGRYPEPDPRIAPSRGNFPENLLTLLHEAYDVKVFESVTDLCANRDEESIVPSTLLKKNFSSVRSDIVTIFLNVLLPAEFRKDVASLAKSWGGFAWQQVDSSRTVFTAEELWQFPNQYRREKFRIFIDSLRPREKPPLYFVHTLLPHVPYEYLPSGKHYLKNPYNSHEYHLKDEYWDNLPEPELLESYQRYLLQVGFIDRLIGELITKLKSEQLFENSLLIVTADHGVSFQSKDYRRPLTENNYMDILPIPLFIKFPGQSQGDVSDANVEITDILPTVASVLKIDIPWKIDGLSVFDKRLTERASKHAMNIHRQGVEHTLNEYPPQFPEMEKSRSYILSNFGAGTSGGDLYKVGKYRRLLGLPASAFPSNWSRRFLPQIDHRGYYEALTLHEDPILTEISGKIQFLSKVDERTLAVIVNDTIRGITQIDDTSSGLYSCLIPEYSLRSGSNSIDVALIQQPLSSRPKMFRSVLSGEYSIKISKWGDESIENPTRQVIPIRSNGGGFLDTVFVTPKSLIGAGWAADVQRGELPMMYLVFVDDRFHFAGIVGDVKRPELARLYKNETLKDAGFVFDFVAQSVRSSKNPKIRVFAVFNEYAAELINKTWTKPVPRQPGKKMMQLVTKSDASQVIAFAQNTGDSPIPVDTTMIGVIELLDRDDENLVIGGWAADVSRGVPAGHVIMMVNDTSLAILPVNASRPDLVKAFRKKGVDRSGFYVTLPNSAIGVIRSSDVIRFFAISKDESRASEVSNASGNVRKR